MKEPTVFVTGADRGIGAALCAACLERGYFVLAGRFTPGQGTLDELAARAGPRLTAIALDVGDDVSVRKAAQAAAAATGHIDLVANVAGTLGETETEIPGVFDFTDALRVYNVNSLGPLRVTNALFPLLAAGAGRTVLNISSEAGSVGTCTRKSWYAYCMSKCALNMQSALTHNRLREIGGRVLVVHPGWVRTWMRGVLDAAADLTPEQSAAGILALAERALQGDPAFDGERPAFVDWKGDALPW